MNIVQKGSLSGSGTEYEGSSNGVRYNKEIAAMKKLAPKRPTSKLTVIRTKDLSHLPTTVVKGMMAFQKRFDDERVLELFVIVLDNLDFDFMRAIGVEIIHNLIWVVVASARRL